MTIIDAPTREPVPALSYGERIGAITQRVRASETPLEALTLLQAAANAMGVDAAAFVSFVKDDDSHDSFRFLMACDLTWCAEYEAQARYTDDPWLAYARTATTPARGRDIPVHGAQQHDVVAVARRYGFVDAFIVPAPSSGNVTRTGVLCLGSLAPDYFEGRQFDALRVQARALAMELHDWWIDRVGRELMQQARLSERDLALLRLERQGRCTKTIANQLGTTAYAVNSRFQRMTEKLGVPNRKTAAKLAAEYGLIP